MSNVFIYDGDDEMRLERRLDFFRQFDQSIQVLKDENSQPLRNEDEIGIWLRRTTIDEPCLVLAHLSQCEYAILPVLKLRPNAFNSFFVLFYRGAPLGAEKVCAQLESEGLGAAGFLPDNVDQSSSIQNHLLKNFFTSVAVNGLGNANSMRLLLRNLRIPKFDLLIALQWFCRMNLSRENAHEHSIHLDENVWRNSIMTLGLGEQKLEAEFAATNTGDEPIATRLVFEYLSKEAGAVSKLTPADYQSSLEEIRNALDHSRSH